MDKIELLSEYSAVYDVDKDDFTLISLARQPKLMIRMMIEHPLHVPVWRRHITIDGLEALRADENGWDNLYTMLCLEWRRREGLSDWIRGAAEHVNAQYQLQTVPPDAPDIEYRWSLKDDEPREDPFADMRDPWAQVTTLED